MTPSSNKIAHLFSSRAYPADIPPPARDRGETIVIGIDSGADYLYHHRIEPDLIIGDMDSIDPRVLDAYEGRDIILRHPARKDRTDTEIAIDWCAENHVRKIFLYNHLSGRYDHAVGMIAQLYRARDADMEICLTSGAQTVQLLKENAVIATAKGRTLSLLALTERVTGIFLRDDEFEYPLTDGVLLRSQCRGISNVAMKDRVSISFDKGDLLVVETSVDTW